LHTILELFFCDSENGSTLFLVGRSTGTLQGMVGTGPGTFIDELMQLAGGSNEIARKHAKAAMDLALGLQHDRRATFRAAALCEEAATSVVNLVAILSGQRDPAPPSPPAAVDALGEDLPF